MNVQLVDWHERLDANFRALREERDRFRLERPLFALEHGLDLENDLLDLKDAVKTSVAEGELSTRAWLPLVVYAAEVGYSYEGEGYWPVFEAETPGWEQVGNDGRTYIRKKYERFAETYGGAVPTGAFTYFRNIAWPITHAILPSDLQKHLARLLYDYRRALTHDLLEDHRALGERLASRSVNTSSRFKQFAENTPLLGLVAASLLLGDKENSPLLLRSTLRRIVTDLSRERQAGGWLRDAKKAAVSIRRRGFTAGTTGARAGPISSAPSETSWLSLELELSVRRGPDGWSAYVAVPSHELLRQRSPKATGDLERVRYRIVGVPRTQPRGALMYKRGPLRLTEWPQSQESVLSPEGGSETLSKLLVDSCRFPSGPWLFRLRDPGFGSEVRTNSVRPGNQYVLLRSRQNPSPLAKLSKPIPFRTEGVSALQLDVPDKVDTADIQELRQLGVGVLSDVRVWPAGLVPSSWDGEGRATWPAGESPIIGIQSSQSAATCVVKAGVEIEKFPWPHDSDFLFVQLVTPATGSHQLDVTLLEPGTDLPFVKGELQLRISEPADSSSNLGARQGLVVHSYPPRPSLEELWTGHAAIVANGPHGERVTFSIALMTRGGRKRLGPETSFSSDLPVSQARWRQLFGTAKARWRQLFGSARDFAKAKGDAEELVVSVSNPQLGVTEVRAERPFTPLRWCAGHDQDGPFARLIDHMDSADLVIKCYDAQDPAQAEQRTIDGGDQVRFLNGGLVVAITPDTPELNASMVVAAHVSGGLESLRRRTVRPSIQTGNRSTASVEKMIRLSHLWTTAAIPGDRNAEELQARVNDAIVARLGEMIGGSKWWDLEREALDGQSPSEQRLIEVAGRSASDLNAAASLLEASRTVGPEPTERAEALGDVLGQLASGLPRSLSGPLLQLATVPGSLPVSDPSVTRAIDVVLEQPVMYRLARLFAMRLADKQLDSGSTLRSWPWQ